MVAWQWWWPCQCIVYCQKLLVDYMSPVVVVAVATVVVVVVVVQVVSVVVLVV